MKRLLQLLLRSVHLLLLRMYNYISSWASAHETGSNCRFLITLSISVLLAARAWRLSRGSLFLEGAWTVYILSQISRHILVWCLELSNEGRGDWCNFSSRRKGLVPCLRRVLIPSCLRLHYTIWNRLRSDYHITLLRRLQLGLSIGIHLVRSTIHNTYDWLISPLILSNRWLQVLRIVTAQLAVVVRVVRVVSAANLRHKIDWLFRVCKTFINVLL